MTPVAAARLFVAVDPPDSVRRELAGWAREAAAAHRGGTGRQLAVPTLRLVDLEMLHITLCFLGSLPHGEIGAVAAAVESTTGSTGELALGAPVWLPPRRPRVLAVEVHDLDGTLGELRAEVSDSLRDACGLELESRRFRPHVTVARMSAGPERDGRVLPATPARSFVPQALSLYRSWLSPQGASYEALATRVLEAP